MIEKGRESGLEGRRESRVEDRVRGGSQEERVEWRECRRLGWSKRIQNRVGRRGQRGESGEERA